MFGVDETSFLCCCVLGSYFFRMKLKRAQKISLSLSLSSVCEGQRSLAKG